jgi:hypothetical protein
MEFTRIGSAAQVLNRTQPTDEPSRRTVDTTREQDAAGRVRGGLLVKLADALEAEQSEFARLLTQEQGKPLPQAQWEIAQSIGTLRYFAALDAGIATLLGKGHNIIFAVTCLKALRAVPEAATPGRIDGLRQMVRSFGKTRGGAGKDPESLVGLDDERKFIHFAFEEFWRAKGDGFDGHVVTIGHALVELYRMGHKGLARKGVPAYSQWVREARAGEDEVGGQVAPAPPRAPTSLTREYWAAQAKRRIGEIVSSHTVKYPYSFYALAREVTDEDLKQRILAKVYHLTATN